MMSNILFIKSGSRINTKNNNLIITCEENKNEIPIEEVSSIVIENLQCSITAAVNVLCSMNNINIIYCDLKHSPVAMSSSYNTYYKQLSRIEDQIKWSDTKKKKLFKKIIEQKIENQIELLIHLKRNQEIIDQIKDLLIGLNVDNFDSREALAARLYFRALFGNRFVRFKDDEINASLNYGYAIMRGRLKQIIAAKGLIPSLGLWHKNQFNNYNLADDIIEPYRTIVDYVTFLLVIKDDDFTNEERIYLQNTIFQKIIYGSSICVVEESFIQFINDIINYMNGNKKDINIPVTRSYLYEY